MEENIKLDLRGSRIGGRLGWGRAGGVEHLCPMAAHVQLPGDRTGSREDPVPLCSAHLRRPRAGLKEKVCCWGWQVAQPRLCNGCARVGFAFLLAVTHGGSEAVAAEANMPVLRPHSQDLYGTHSYPAGQELYFLCVLMRKLIGTGTFTLPRSARYKVATCSHWEGGSF